MQENSLIQLMADQANNLEELIITLKKIQKFIVSSDIENLEEQVEREEKILHRLKLKEIERTNAIKDLINQENLNCELEDAMDLISEKMSEADPSIYEAFLLLRKQLTENVGQVMYLNSQNSILINNSRNFIKDLLRNLLGSRKDNFFDKKV
ncbi:MAG: flagellar export chaperone FlgN [Ignavibacteriaceae bacterium]|nr:flagellar export chaperone FlgN [Ignavibacteriaceae bacterium]